ncbi:MAG: MarR family transcriptional regulator [Candidatus Brocadiia bacterium]
MPNSKVKETSIFMSELIPRIIKGAQIEFLASQKITHLQFLTLVALSCYQDCKMSQLARTMKMSYPQATGIVDRLIKTGLVSRTSLDNDRRVVLIRLAPKGAAFIRQFKIMLQLRWQRIFSAMPDPEITALLKSLKNIAARIEEVEQDE